MLNIKILYLVCLLSWGHYAVAQNEVLTASRDVSGLYGYVDAVSQKYIIKPQFELAFPFSINGVAKVVIDGKWGMIDAKGRTIAKPKYEYIGWSDEAFYEAYLQNRLQSTKETNYYDFYDKNIPFRRLGKWGLINVKGKVVIEPQYELIQHPKNRVAVVAKRENYAQPAVYGLIDSKGNEVVKPQFQYLTPNSKHTQFIVGREEKTPQGKIITNFGVITPQGMQLIPVKYRALRDYNEMYAVQDSSFLWTILDVQGNIFFADKFEAVKTVKDDLAIVKKNGKWGIVGKDGKIKVPFEYQDIYQKDIQNFALLPFTKWKLLNNKSETIEEYYFEALEPISATLFRYQLNEKLGVIDNKGKIIEKAIYDEFYPFKDKLAIVREGDQYAVVNQFMQKVVANFDSIALDSLDFIKVRRDNNGKKQWGLYNYKAKLVIPILYEDIKVIAKDLFAVKQDGIWGYMDAQSLWTIVPRFQEVTPFAKGLAVVKYNAQVGIIDLNGKWIIEPVFDDLKILSRQIATFRSDKRIGLLDIDKKEIKILADTLHFLPNGLIKTQNKTKWGLYNIFGDEIIPDEYLFISECTQDSIFTVYKEGNYSLINQKGKFVIKNITYHEMDVMSEGLVAVRVHKTWGYINDRRKKRISSRYGGAKPFHENMAAVKIGEFWGYINSYEVLVVNPIYEEAESFRNGYALVKSKNKWGFIDKTQRIKIEIRYDSIVPISDYWLTYLNGKVGLINKDLKEVIYPKYDAITSIDEKHLLVKRGEKWGVADEQGRDVIPALYDYLFINPYNDLYLVGQEQHWITTKIE